LVVYILFAFLEDTKKLKIMVIFMFFREKRTKKNKNCQKGKGGTFGK